jgi:transposase InsO family protein
MDEKRGGLLKYVLCPRNFNFYNFERTHQALDGKTPVELYFGTAAPLKAA